MIIAKGVGTENDDIHGRDGEFGGRVDQRRSSRKAYLAKVFIHFAPAMTHPRQPSRQPCFSTRILKKAIQGENTT